jgi:thiosulfate dehydrogenase
MLVAIGAVLATVSAGSAQSQRAAIDRVVPLHVSDESTIPEGPVGTAVRYGKNGLTDTQTYARAYVGNGLNCASCHLDAGRRAYSSPWVGLWGMFPEYRSRNGQVNALQDRIKIASNVR